MALVPINESRSQQSVANFAFQGSEQAQPKHQLALPAPKNQGTQQDAEAQNADGLDDVKAIANTNTQARGYNELMDEYSLHQLMFRKGKLIDQTPEFISFRRNNIEKWGPVSFILMNFEKLFTDFNV
jgi:hypothetical protein